MQFKKAERKQVKVKLALTGASGAGKTYSALLIAKGLGGKIGLIDTENESASLYSGVDGLPEFQALDMAAPFTSARYIEAIEAARKDGIQVLIIDSISHQWTGEGGIMDRMDKEQMAKPGVNKWSLWAKYTPEHEQFKSAITQADMHVICTMRSKQEYILETNEKGKQAPRKVGTAPIQRDGTEYDYTIVFDMQGENYCSVSKDRTGIFSGQHFKPTVKTGEAILTWLNSGKVVEKTPPVSVTPNLADLSKTRTNDLTRFLDPVKWPTGSVVEFMKLSYGTGKPGELTEDQFKELMGTVKEKTASQAKVEFNAKNPPDVKPEEPQAGMFDETAGTRVG